MFVGTNKEHQNNRRSRCPLRPRLVDLQDRIRRIQADRTRSPRRAAVWRRGARPGAAGRRAGAWRDARNPRRRAAMRRMAPRRPGSPPASPGGSVGSMAACTGRGAVVPEAGDLYGPGLAAHGLDPARIALCRRARDDDILWALEEGLRTPRSPGGIAAVVGEIGRLPMVAGRRLQLAAERSGIPACAAALAHRRGGGSRRDRPSAAMTRWRVASLPVGCPKPGAGEPGIGRPRWRVELLRCRGGRRRIWIWRWRMQSGVVRLPAELADRPAVPPDLAAGPQPGKRCAQLK